jgi:precorrin-2 dehydrogenase / sirohydrochlorin ferrochelatase
MKRPPPAKVFPLFLKLENRPCLAVGAGNIAESKIGGLVESDATVRVVAPEATPQVRAWAQAKKLDWHQRPFQPADLQGMFLVVAGTSSPQLHEQIFGEARRLGVLCNVVDVPHLCDFYYPAVVRRGSLQIAISTAGESPALAQRLRKELEVQFGPEYEAWVAAIGEVRAEIATKNMSAEDRKELLHHLASEEFFLRFRDGIKKTETGDG